METTKDTTAATRLRIARTLQRVRRERAINSQWFAVKPGEQVRDLLSKDVADKVLNTLDATRQRGSTEDLLELCAKWWDVVADSDYNYYVGRALARRGQTLTGYLVRHLYRTFAHSCERAVTYRELWFIGEDGDALPEFGQHKLPDYEMCGSLLDLFQEAHPGFEYSTESDWWVYAGALYADAGEDQEDLAKAEALALAWTPFEERTTLEYIMLPQVLDPLQEWVQGAAYGEL